MEKQYEELSQRLDSIEVTLKELKEGVHLLLASSEMNKNARGYGEGSVHNNSQKNNHKSQTLIMETRGDKLDLILAAMTDISKSLKLLVETKSSAEEGGLPHKKRMHISKISGRSSSSSHLLKANGDIIPNKERYHRIKWKDGASLAPAFRYILEGLKGLPQGPFSLSDIKPFITKERSETSSSLLLEGVLQRFKSFKRFDTVSDVSDHYFSSQRQEPKADWEAKLTREWKNVELDLPENMFVRGYEGRPDLLRVAVIGPVGTPFHDGLFFFDMCFPRSYPSSPPLVRFYSRGICLTQSIHGDGSLSLYLPKRDGGKMQLRDVWVPGTSTVLDFLRFLRGLFNPQPLLDGVVNSQPTFMEGVNILVYNELTFLRSITTMADLMRRPPKNFEDLVIGHFRSHADDIVRACEAYKKGARVGSNVKDGEEDGTVSESFKEELTLYMKPLIASFKRIGAL